MKNTLLAFAAISILANYFHTYWIIDYVSNVKERFLLFNTYKINPKNIQNYIFCLIISTSIMFLVFLELHILALIGCLIEMILNSYYVYCSYSESYYNVDLTLKKNEKILAQKVRKQRGAYFIGLLIPVCIYTFSYLYVTI